MKHIYKVLRVARAEGITVLPATCTFIHKWKESSCLYSVSIHQMAPPLIELADIWLLLTTHLSTQKGERLSWPGWWTCSGRFTHISGHLSAAGRAQERKVGQQKTGVPPLCHATNQTLLSVTAELVWSLTGGYMIKLTKNCKSTLSLSLQRRI